MNQRHKMQSLPVNTIKDYWPPDKLKRKYFIKMSNVYSSKLLPFYSHLQ